MFDILDGVLLFFCEFGFEFVLLGLLGEEEIPIGFDVWMSQTFNPFVS